MNDSQELRKLIEERLASLPVVVQRAIASSDVQQHLRELSTTHKLHLDQWESLEHIVMFTLLGIQPIEDLESNIVSEVGVPADIARTLTESINAIVFEPIRQELERQLEHPQAREKEVSGIEAARAQTLDQARPEASSPQQVANPGSESATSYKLQATSSVAPATPPAPVPDVKVTRPTESSNYKPGQTSAARAAVHEDPYRESPI